MSKENPKDCRYTKEHEWVKVEGDVATLGITDHAQELLTDIVFVELPAEGKELAQMDAYAVVESVKSVSDVYAPIGGTVKEVNTALEDSPELINEDAFGDGWIAKLEGFDEGELDKLMTAEEYEQYLEEEGDH